MLDAAQFTVPYPEHPYFVGRDDDLARLHEALNGDAPVGINPAALGNPTGVTGQGGIGKTQLAVRYAYRYQDHYPNGVYWLNAAEDLRQEFAGLGRHLLGQGGQVALKSRIWETLRTQFSVEEIRDLCLELGVEHEEFSRELGRSALARELIDYFDRRLALSLLEGAVRQKRGELATLQAQDELIDYAFGWLQEHSRSLLILDNVADPGALDEPLIRNNVPSRLPVQLLFTTRRRELGRFRPVELKTLPLDAALALLLRDPRRAAALDPTHSEHETARDICAVFGYLPLALEIAAAHLAKFPAPLAAYRDELRRRGALDVMTDRRVPVATRHETGLAAALAAQWTALGSETQLLLRVAGQFPEAAYIPTARLGLLAGVPEEGQSFFDVTLDVALVELQDASLIEELAGDQLRLHPLVREFARDRTPLTQKDAFIGECVRRLLTAFGNIQTLERQCDRRGIDALIHDLMAARELLDGALSENATLKADCETYLTVLRREAHNLRGWRKSDAPAFLAQQLHLRLFDSDTPTLFGDLVTSLRAIGQAWFPRWAARHASPTLAMTLTGHTDGVLAVAVTPDGRWAVSGGSDGTLRLWSLETGEAERTLTEHAGVVRAIVGTADGRRIISGGDEGTLRVWNLETGEAEQTLTGHVDRVQAVAVTADGRRAISGGRDGTLRVWNLETGEAEQTLTDHVGQVYAVTVTADGQRAVTSGDDGTLLLWNLETGEVERTLTGHVDRVQAVAVTGDGRRAVSGGDDGTLRLWNLETGEAEQTLTDQAGVLWAVAVVADGHWAVSGGEDGALRLWDLDIGEMERTLIGHAGTVYAVAVTADGRRAVSGGYDGTLRVWNLETVEVERMLNHHVGSVWAVAVAADGRQAVSGGDDRTLRVWSLETGEVEQMLNGHMAWVPTVAVTTDGRLAISGGYDRTLRLWELGTGKVKRELTGHADGVNAVAVTANGQRAVSGGDDGTLHVWNLDTGAVESTLTGHAKWVRALAMTGDGRRAVSGGRDETLRLWNLETGEVERTLIGHVGWVWAAVFTAGGRRAISGGRDRILRVWDLDTGIVDRKLIGHVGSVRALAVTPDGQWVVSGGDDRTLRLWALDTGSELGRISLDVNISCVAVVPGRPLRVVAGDAAGDVYCLEWVE